MSSKKLTEKNEFELLDALILNEKKQVNQTKNTKSKKCSKTNTKKCSKTNTKNIVKYKEELTTSSSETQTTIKRGPRGRRGHRGFSGYYLPNGVILLWYGNTNTIPSGWVVCDGTTYGAYTTPDLRGRFVLAYGTTGDNYPLDFNASVGLTGGEQNHTLTLSEIPTHNHGNTGSGTTGNYPLLSTGITGAHIHTASSGTTGAHVHSVSDPGHNHSSNAIGGQGNYGLCIADGTNTVINTDGSAGELNVWTVPGALTINSNTTGITINSAGNHSHSITVDTAGDHSHSVSLTSIGGNQEHNNMPPYYVLIYIMKVH